MHIRHGDMSLYLRICHVGMSCNICHDDMSCRYVMVTYVMTICHAGVSCTYVMVICHCILVYVM